MGQILSFECGDCNYGKTFYTGSGMLDFDSRKQKELFNCPHCGSLSLRTVKYESNRGNGPSIEKKQKCGKCRSLMVWAEKSKELTCPNCHSNNCICFEVGQWD